MNNVTEWIISGNPDMYKVEDAFLKLKKVDWKQSTNVAVGDIVYIYLSKKIAMIKLKCHVNKVSLERADIDDKEFYNSDEDNDSYGRYMELELIEILNGNVYSRNELEKHGFISPQSPMRVPVKVKKYLDLIQKLQHSDEMNPDKHDGSYELMRETIRAYKNKGDLLDCDYRDLNLVYLTCVGTWKQGLDAKRKTIDESHLSETEKARLKELLSVVWDKTTNSEYSNYKDDKPNIGMFGTGFYTFLGKTDEDSPRNFIQMCIDILDMQDDKQIFDRCSKTLNSNFHGMKSASASVVLHCLKPFTFPVFNKKMGSNNIYVYFGVDLDKKTEIYTYIKNCREVKKYRDENFKIKNYRIFDIAARELGISREHTNIDYLSVLNYLDNNNQVPYSDPDAVGLSSSERDRLFEMKAQSAVNEMKEMVKICSDNFGLDKCEPMLWLDGSNTKTRKYLWAQMKYSKFTDSPVSISIFVEISPLLNKARYRFSLEIKNDGTDKKQMNKYHRFLDMPLHSESSLVYVVGSNEIGRIDIINETANVIKQKIDNGTYKKVQLCRIEEWTEGRTNDDFESAMIEGISELIPYYQYVNDDLSSTYWPSLEEYNPGITTEKWIELLQDSEVTSDSHLAMFKMMLELGGESTCANLASKYGGVHGTYNVLGREFGERVHKKINCPLYIDNVRKRFYTIPFIGRYVEEDGKRRYSWKLRDELKQVLESMDLSKIDISSLLENNGDFDKNMILYGPPGTGKTYNSAIYAVAICDGKSVDELTDYNAVMYRYNELKKEGRIAFTTFHQSYGYEEFIEGISPVIVSDNNSFQKDGIGYKYKSGSFKLFCNSARNRTIQTSNNNTNVKNNARVWSILLGGTGDTELKRLCFDENESSIRIGWSDLPEVITNDTQGLNDVVRRIILNFQDEMEIGDVVVSQSTNESIDAIGIITGDYEFDITRDSKYKRKRKVIWIVKGINENIVSLNAGVKLDRKTVYPLDRINVNDIFMLADKFVDATDVVIKEETRPYVFIIDEINRGNISKIFGELITLIEDTKREGMPEAASAILPYSGEYFSVPKNVYILGTMNTADRSIALMDTALRRRFSFVEMMPESAILRKIGADKVNSLDVADMLDTINERISFLYDREHTIGHSFFTSLKDDPTVKRLQSIFEKTVIPLLQEYFYEDYKKIQMVLGDNGKSDPSLKFIKDEKVIEKSIFKGKVEDVIDLPEKKYSINKVALSNIQSYIEIM